MAGFYITDDGALFLYVHLKRDRYLEGSHSASRVFLAKALGKRTLLRRRSPRRYKVSLGRVRLTEIRDR